MPARVRHGKTKFREARLRAPGWSLTWSGTFPSNAFLYLHICPLPPPRTLPSHTVVLLARLTRLPLFCKAENWLEEIAIVIRSKTWMRREGEQEATLIFLT